MHTQQIVHGTQCNIPVPEDDIGSRIDLFLANYFEQYSRSFLQKLFTLDKIIINGTKPVKPSYKLKALDIITVQFPEQEQPLSRKQFFQTPSESTDTSLHQQHDVKIIEKNEHFLIINKPAGLVVHAPNPNYQEATLADWIVHTHDEIAHVGLIDRPGIVHRLDKDTSGLMIIPRTNAAHGTLTDMFKARDISKTYLAIVMGHPPKSGSIDFLIGRHPTVRNKMHHFTQATKRSDSRTAHTNYEVLTYFKEHALVQIKPISGRTHQIRVHFAAIGYPLLGDFLYGKKSKLLGRHALHAHQLEFEYEGKQYSFSSPLQADMQALIDNLPQD